MATRIARPKKPTGQLKEYLGAVKAETRLIGPIERYLMARPADTSRRTDVLHPSAICRDDWCTLASYYALSGRKAKEVRPGFHLERIFEEGHSVHAKYQRWLTGAGVLYGMWRCMACQHKWWEMGSFSMTCPKCSFDTIRYAEVPVASKRHRIAGHADGWVDPALIEIKTVGVGTVRVEAPQLLIAHDNNLDEVWKNIRRPFKKHRLQGQLYLAMLELMEQDGTLVLPPGCERPQEIVFLYEYKPNQQVKEFVVAHDMSAVADILDTALDVVFAVEKERPPACPNGGSCDQCKLYEEN